MGQINSRLNINFEGLPSNGRRSQQDETSYSYSLNKSYFSNYFLMGGERFEVSDPDYLFGDSNDLNFLSCTKPHSLPYRKAQQNILANLNTKHKSNNKSSNRLIKHSSPFSILTGGRDGHRNSNGSPTSGRKQDAQTQTLDYSKELTGAGIEPSKPLVMFMNIRKETLRLVKCPLQHNLDSDQNSLTNSYRAINGCTTSSATNLSKSTNARGDSEAKQLQQQSSRLLDRQAQLSKLDPSTSTSQASGDCSQTSNSEHASQKTLADISATSSSSMTSLTSAKSGGYTSVEEVPQTPIGYNSDEENEHFEDALNDATNLHTKETSENEVSLAAKANLKKAEEDSKFTKEERDIKIAIECEDVSSASNSCDIKPFSSDDQKKPPMLIGGVRYSADCTTSDSGLQQDTTKLSTTTTAKLRQEQPATTSKASSTPKHRELGSDRVYNIEFYFDAIVDCSIRLFYFCTREISSTNGVTFKPQHATYKSKIYSYKKGLNQKFEQFEHTFQPYLFDEDLLIYKPLDIDGNYNSGSVFPIVIHCAALEGPHPRQSMSLVATVEKSQLDESYSIKPLKQLIYVDGVQYILQDIYGIEHKQLLAFKKCETKPKLSSDQRTRQIRTDTESLQSTGDVSRLNLAAETVSLASIASSSVSLQNKDQKFRSFGSDNNYECVICMSDERDTMLLPCRHLCLCASCSQSLRYQANSCPICRCPFKAALNLRPIERGGRRRSSSSVSSVAAATVSLDTSKRGENSTSKHNSKRSNESLATPPANKQNSDKQASLCSGLRTSSMESSTRRESITNPATPLLYKPNDVVVNLNPKPESSTEGRRASVSSNQVAPQTNSQVGTLERRDKQQDRDNEARV